MFHHHSENSASTGEPPTLPETNSSRVTSQTAVQTHSESSQRPPRGSSRSLNAQEPDSGYEASPSSIADTNSCTLHFFGEPSADEAAAARSSAEVGEEDDDDIQDSVFLILNTDSEDDIDEWDMCPDCNSDSYCCCRNDSSNTTTSDTTAIVAGELCDNSSYSSDLSSSHRPSSLPIQIPMISTRGVSRTLPWTDTSPRLDLCLRQSRSHPVDLTRRDSTPSFQQFSLIAGSHPLSWPSQVAPWSNHRGPFALPIFLSSNLRSTAWVARTRTRRNHREQMRNRRFLIDSDASSLSSSEEEGPEDVFDMAAETPPSFGPDFHPMLGVTNGSGPLPDLVLGSSSPAISRRSRSTSVNLPPDLHSDIIDENVRQIGRSLRRLSDQFEQRQFQLRNRRTTISDFMHFRRAS